MDTSIAQIRALSDSLSTDEMANSPVDIAKVKAEVLLFVNYLRDVYVRFQTKLLTGEVLTENEISEKNTQLLNKQRERDSHESERRKLKSQVRKLRKQRLDESATQISKLEGRISELEGKVATLNEEISKLNSEKEQALTPDNVVRLSDELRCALNSALTTLYGQTNILRPRTTSGEEVSKRADAENAMKKIALGALIECSRFAGDAKKTNDFMSFLNEYSPTKLSWFRKCALYVVGSAQCALGAAATFTNKRFLRAALATASDEFNRAFKQIRDEGRPVLGTITTALVSSAQKLSGSCIRALQGWVTTGKVLKRVVGRVEKVVTSVCRSNRFDV